MKKLLNLIALACLCIFALTPTKSFAQSCCKPTVFDYTVEDIEGNDFDFGSLKGKKVMIVNVASKCGFTYQYEALQALYEKYKDQNFIIIGFPANNYNNQESGDNASIQQFCSATYGVEFPMMAKVSTKGDDMADIYKWLTTKKMNGSADYTVNWNFNKFLINPDGTIYKKLESKVEPNDAEITEWIESK